MPSNGAKLAMFTSQIERVFKNQSKKRDALAQTVSILRDMSGDRALLTEIIRKHLQTPGALSKGNYPVVGMDCAVTPYFGFVANCWIPMPNGQNDLSTKSIHHHGDMLLNTVTAFGTGYEHWTFTRPEETDPEQELFALHLVERAPHPLHHVAFVDTHMPHVPFFPAELTITFALWTSQTSVTWKDHLKRLEVFRGRERKLRELALKAGLKRALDLKVVEYFDFYPTESGFKGIRDRKEFPLGPNADYLHSLFHVIQKTGNDGLLPEITLRLDASVPDYSTARELVQKLKTGIPIEGRLSTHHYQIPNANFTASQIERALSASARLLQSASA